MTEVDQRITLAREYLARTRDWPIDHLPPSRMAAELAETRRQLGQVLAAVDGQADEAGRLARIRQVLAEFDWEFHDRQLALEAIDRIQGGGER
jgi:hypothetical protein